MIGQTTISIAIFTISTRYRFLEIIYFILTTNSMLILYLCNVCFNSMLLFSACPQGWQQFQNSCYFSSASIGDNSYASLAARSKHWYKAQVSFFYVYGEWYSVADTNTPDKCTL